MLLYYFINYYEYFISLWILFQIGLIKRETKDSVKNYPVRKSSVYIKLYFSIVDSQYHFWKHSLVYLTVS